MTLQTRLKFVCWHLKPKALRQNQWLLELPKFTTMCTDVLIVSTSCSSSKNVTSLSSSWVVDAQTQAQTQRRQNHIQFLTVPRASKPCFKWRVPEVYHPTLDSSKNHGHGHGHGVAHGLRLESSVQIRSSSTDV